MPLQPASRTGLLVVDLAAHPEAGEGTCLRVDMMRLHVIQQLGVALVLLVALVPVADAVVPLASFATSATCARREAYRLGLRQNGRDGALGQRFAGRLRQLCVHNGRGGGRAIIVVAAAAVGRGG